MEIIRLLLCMFTTISTQSQLLKKLMRVQADPSFSIEIDNNRKMVILLTRFRSGSTFLGDVFNQNPNVLYEFEPLHPSTLKGSKGNKYWSHIAPFSRLYLVKYDCIMLKILKNYENPFLSNNLQMVQSGLGLLEDCTRRI